MGAIRRFEPETLVTIFRDICALEYREDAVEFLLDTVNWIFLNLLSETILLPIRCGLPRRGDGWIACLEVIDKAVALQQSATIRRSASSRLKLRCRKAADCGALGTTSCAAKNAAATN